MKLKEHKLAICIHVFYIEKIFEILNYINNIPYEYDIFITVPSYNSDNLKNILKNKNIKIFRIIEVENTGYDILPFIKLLPQLKELNYSLICKIHTKKGAANLENIVSGIDNIWSDILLNSILGTTNLIKDIVKNFTNNTKIGMIGSADLYKSIDSLMFGNEIYVNKLLNIFGLNYFSNDENGFIAGTMFWARIDIFEPILNNYNNILKILDTNATHSTGTIATVYHAFERIFGLLPGIARKEIALVYALDENKHIHYIEIKEKIQFIPKVGIGITLENELNLKNNLEKLKKTKGFNLNKYKDNYLKKYNFHIDPYIHFLRYGMFLNYSPDFKFDIYCFWSENRSTLEKRKNAFLYYLENKEKYNNINFLHINCIDNIIDIIKKSSFFDENYYREQNPNALSRTSMEPAEHYCKVGWKEKRLPSVNFDVTWYEAYHLNNYLIPINPVLHYELYGKHKNFKPNPSYRILNKKISMQNTPKRICLFASYDKDCIIDNTVITFVKELSKYSDVYFLSDSNISDDELTKLKLYVKGAWAYRHEEYDFGSYKRLAKYHVGWNKLMEYDELLFVNDSSYLLGNLDNIFNKMDKKNTSFWGLQATKGTKDTKNKKSNKFKKKIPITDVKKIYLEKYFLENDFDFHIGSYFLAFRNNIICDKGFQNFINNISKQIDKKNIVLKYEIGLTKYLLSKQYDFDTFMDHLYPFHPVYTNNIYKMIENGFPLFKRLLLTNNHYEEKKLFTWKDKLLGYFPNLDIESIERNIYRVADISLLIKNLDIEKYHNTILSEDEFIERDKYSKIEKNLWIFPVCAYTHNLDDNCRAIYEKVKNDEKIKKVILFKSKIINIDGKNIDIVPFNSREAQEYLLESHIIFIKHASRVNIPYTLDHKKHKIINLWHGIPLKALGTTSNSTKNIRDKIHLMNSECHAIISSSDIDKLAMCSSFYPLKYDQVWLTGLPRHDFILEEIDNLPLDFKQELNTLDKLINNKKFILFCPTFRNNNIDYYKFSITEKLSLYEYLEKFDIILGIREHMTLKNSAYYSQFSHKNIISVGNNIIQNVEMLYRKADLLITDYSSCFIDFMLTNKPMISFAYDYNNYQKERGLLYDINLIFPGTICMNFEELILELEKQTIKKFKKRYNYYKIKKELFHKFGDKYNSDRVLSMIKNL